MAERRLRPASRIDAGAAASPRPSADPTRDHFIADADMIRARIHAIACGYEDADGFSTFLRTDPAFKLAVAAACPRRAAASVLAYPPSSTLSRMENAPSAERRDPPDTPTRSSINGWRSYRTRAGQRHSRYRRHLLQCRRTAISNSPLFNAPLRRALLSADPCLRHRAKPPPSRSCCDLARRPAASKCAPICAAWSDISAKCWPKTRITFRGDGHYARPEAMTWCEKNGSRLCVPACTGTQPLSKKSMTRPTRFASWNAYSGENKDIVRG